MSKFKIMDSEYFNTGGHCMVLVSTIYDREANRTFYAYTNEESCLLYGFDWLRDGIDNDPSVTEKYYIDGIDSFSNYNPIRYEFSDDLHLGLIKRCIARYARVSYDEENAWTRVPLDLIQNWKIYNLPEGYVDWWNDNHGRDFMFDGDSIYIDSDYYEDRYSDESVYVKDCLKVLVDYAKHHESEFFNKLPCIYFLNDELTENDKFNLLLDYINNI